MEWWVYDDVVYWFGQVEIMGIGLMELGVWIGYVVVCVVQC